MMGQFSLWKSEQKGFIIWVYNACLCVWWKQLIRRVCQKNNWLVHFWASFSNKRHGNFMVFHTNCTSCQNSNKRWLIAPKWLKGSMDFHWNDFFLLFIYVLLVGVEDCDFLLQTVDFHSSFQLRGRVWEKWVIWRCFSIREWFRFYSASLLCDYSLILSRESEFERENCVRLRKICTENYNAAVEERLSLREDLSDHFPGIFPLSPQIFSLILERVHEKFRKFVKISNDGFVKFRAFSGNSKRKTACVQY